MKSFWGAGGEKEILDPRSVCAQGQEPFDCWNTEVTVPCRSSDREFGVCCCCCGLDGLLSPNYFPCGKHSCFTEGLPVGEAVTWAAWFLVNLKGKG